MFPEALKHGHVEYCRMFSGFEDRLEELCRHMDQAYRKVAGDYVFFCTGCKTCCCETRFYHHTLIEYFYLRKGFHVLDHVRQATILQKAGAVLNAYSRADEQHKNIRIPCPLFENGQCGLYSYRPMICRLHGIPHEFQKQGGERLLGPGCDAFYLQCGDASYKTFDRTPFYRRMAALEQDLRKSIGIYDKFKMTIAEMLVWDKDIVG